MIRKNQRDMINRGIVKIIIDMEVDKNKDKKIEIGIEIEIGIGKRIGKRTGKGIEIINQEDKTMTVPIKNKHKIRNIIQANSIKKNIMENNRNQPEDIKMDGKIKSKKIEIN